jgi:5'-3' exonuclease
MGVANFHVWLRQQYPKCHVSIKNNNIYEYIYIDGNFLLHNSVHGIKSEQEFVTKLYMQLDVIFSNFIATKKIFIALDGPSSFAKILLQRKRRLVNSGKINNKMINSLHITPGIEKMKEIEEYIKIYIKKLKSKYRYVCPEIDFSPASEADEGEIKICKQIIKNGLEYLDHRHLIVGNDSDLIVLSMATKPIYNINVFIRGRGENELVSLKELLKLHCNHIGRNDTIENLSKSNIRYDFVIISLMMGNDYLPKLIYVNYENLWKNYFTIMKILPDNLILDDLTFNVEMMQALLFDIYTHMPQGYQKISIKLYNETKTKSYLEGMLWCLKMYQDGNCPKYDYIYTGTASPHPFELMFYMYNENLNFEILSDAKPVPLNLYPLLIMPKNALYLVDKKYTELAENELKYLYESEECEECKTYKLNVKNLYNVMMEGTDESKNKYNIELKKYTTHKKIHHVFNVNDIHKIIGLKI